MCGIAGEAHAAAYGEEQLSARNRRLDTMLDVLRRRGPDDVDVHLESRVALGARRLAIVDVPAGRQPISTADGRYTITYNGECYGVAGLRDELAASGVVFRTRSDTEVVLHAFARWGPAALPRLNGMFALAIWDARERALFLARDRFGIKPLYYQQDENRLVFASTAAAIAARDDVDRRIDASAIELFLSSKFIPAPYSIYRSIRKLPAGYWARWHEGRFLVRRWWDLPVEADPATDLSQRAARDQAATLLAAATRSQAVAERPVGLCLSGGIDSGLLAAELRPLRTPTFSIGSQQFGFDETPIARKVARRFGLPSRVVHLPAQPSDLLDDVVAALDEPLGDPSCTALYALSQVMSRRVTVVLSGTGGDELFGGYRRYLAARLARLTASVPGWRRWTQEGDRWAGRFRNEAWSRFAAAAADGPLACYLQLLQPTSSGIAARLRRPEFMRAADVTFAELAGDFFERPRNHSLLARLSYVDMRTVLPDGYLAKEDRMTMAHAVEGRFPFLDHHLAEWAFLLPDRFKQRGLQTKRLLRQLAARRGLPAEVVSGRKQGFEVPLSAWFRGPLAGRLHDSLLPRDAAVKQFCRGEVINSVVHEHVNGQADHGRLLWCLVVLESWLERNAGGSRNGAETKRCQTPFL